MLKRRGRVYAYNATIPLNCYMHSGNDDIYITGSNSQLLSSEFSTVIGGRVLEYKLQPFTFREFLDFHGYSKLDQFSIIEKKIELSQLFDTYLEYGGFYETFLLTEDQKVIYRKSLLEKIVLKDIINRYRINKPDIIQNLFLYIAKNPGTIVSAAKLRDITDSKKNTTSLTTCLLISVWNLGGLRTLATTILLKNTVDQMKN